MKGPRGGGGKLWLSLLLLGLLSGCVSPVEQQEKPEPFQFRSLRLRQNDPQGQPLWELQSPKARYKLHERQAVVQQPVGLLFRKGKPHYRITAPRGVVYNDGEQVDLLDGARLVSLDGRQLVITSRRAIWRPGKDTIDLLGKPMAEDPGQRLTAGQARFYLKNELLELRQQPLLRQWRRQQSHLTVPSLELLTSRADWYTQTGLLKAAGPIRSVQRQKQKQRLLTASGLEGNTREQWLDFLAPVSLNDPAEKIQIQAGRSRWWIEAERVTSAEPAQGQIRKLQVSGSDLELLDRQHQVSVGRNCFLRQPGEWLRAERCRWNWSSGALVAEGAVQLHRDKLQQLTRAERLEGSSGADGTVLFSAPGQRVETQLRFAPGAAATKPQGPPVQF